MCDKCREYGKYWLHIADHWTDEEKKEMIKYLITLLSDYKVYINV